MSRLFLTILSVLTAAISVSADKQLTVRLANPLSMERKAVPVVVPVASDVRSAVVMIAGKEVPCQLDDLNDDGLFDELSFVTDMKKKEKLTATVTLSTEGEPRTYEMKTYGAMAMRDRNKSASKPQHLPVKSVTCPGTSNTYQYIFPHGPVMESDMVGFRVYADHRQSLDYYGHKQLRCDIAETNFYPPRSRKRQAQAMMCSIQARLMAAARFMAGTARTL